MAKLTACEVPAWAIPGVVTNSMSIYIEADIATAAEDLQWWGDSWLDNIAHRKIDNWGSPGARRSCGKGRRTLHCLTVLTRHSWTNVDFFMVLAPW